MFKLFNFNSIIAAAKGAAYPITLVAIGSLLILKLIGFEGCNKWIALIFVLALILVGI